MFRFPKIYREINESRPVRRDSYGACQRAIRLSNAAMENSSESDRLAIGSKRRKQLEEVSYANEIDDRGIKHPAAFVGGGLLPVACQT
jgi:hypothetical protein